MGLEHLKLLIPQQNLWIVQGCPVTFPLSSCSHTALDWNGPWNHPYVKPPCCGRGANDATDILFPPNQYRDNVHYFRVGLILTPWLHVIINNPKVILQGFDPGILIKWAILFFTISLEIYYFCWMGTPHHYLISNYYVVCYNWFKSQYSVPEITAFSQL